ncbi:hypothetical protein D3C78_549270 [compost metagenome]
MVEEAAEKIMASDRVRQLSQMFDAPQYAQQFIDLARKTQRCRSMQIRARCVLTDAQGKQIIDPKTKAPKYGFVDWAPSKESA